MVTVRVVPVSPEIGLPAFNHWLPEDVELVKTVLSPLQKVPTPEIVGVAGKVLTVTVVGSLVFEHPLALVIVTE